MHPMILDELRRRPRLTVGRDYKEAALADNATVLYMLDEASGVFIDSGPYGHHLTPYGSPLRAQPGLIDGYDCTEFSGTSQYGRTLNNLSAMNATAYTFEAVVQDDNPTSGVIHVIFHNGNLWAANNQGIRFEIGQTGLLRFIWFAGGSWHNVSSASPLPAAVPVHVCGVIAPAPGTISFYFDGVLDSTFTLPTFYATTAYGSTLGAYGTGGSGGYFDGKVAGVAVYAGQSFSAAQVADHYSATGL